MDFAVRGSTLHLDVTYDVSSFIPSMIFISIRIALLNYFISETKLEESITVFSKKKTLFATRRGICKNVHHVFLDSINVYISEYICFLYFNFAIFQ